MPLMFPDITIEDEACFRQKESSFQDLADFLPQPVWIADADGAIYWYNQSWLKQTGQLLLTMRQAGWQAIHDPETLANTLMEWERAIATGEPFQMTFLLNCADGVCRALLTRVSPVRDHQGRILRWFGVASDIQRFVKVEQALTDAQQEYQALFTHARESILITDNDGRYLNANPAACQTLGLPLQDVVGHTVQELFLPEQPDVFTDMWHHFLQEGTMSGEIPYVRPDGQHMIFEFCAVAHYFPGRHLSILRDITERKTSQDALLQSEQRFREMADSAPLFIWLGDADGKTYYLNKTWLDFLGMSHQEALNGGIQSAMFPEDRLETRQIYWEAFAQQEPYTLETRFRRADGQIRWILSKGAPQFANNGQFTGYIGISVDITDRKQAEALLQQGMERERLLHRIVEIISQSFDIDFILKTVAEETGRYFHAERCSVSRFSIHSDKILLNLSAQYCAENCRPVDEEDIALITNAIQHLRPEVMAENREEILNVSDQEQYIAHLRARMATLPELPGLSTEKLIEIIRKYNVMSSLRVNIYYRGTHYGSISLSQCSYNREWQPEEIELLQNIAEHAGSALYQVELYNKAQETAVLEHAARKAMERYARKLEISNRDLEQFAAIASHDLQEPLRKVQMFSQMIAANCNEAGVAYVERMQSAVSRMQDLITDVLALSRISRASQPFQAVDLNHIIRNVLDDLVMTIQDKKPNLVVYPLQTVDGDSRQLEQLFMNLIGNAIKFQKQDVVAEIEISGQMVSENCYQVIVADQGIGFNPTYRDRIFEPFERLHGRSGKYQGTGMGLAIVRKIVERHNGSIEVESEEGNGSRFIVTLPIHNAD